MSARKLHKRDVTFAIRCLPEDLQIEGNASAIDEDTDRATVRHIRDQLESGNEWAWCCVEVAATLEITSKRKTARDGNTVIGYVDADVSLTGHDYLGGCSYLNEAEFKRGGYYEDMCDVALADLQAQVDAIRDALYKVST